MHIEQGSAHTKYKYWTVRVDPNELQCDTRPLPYGTWIGTITEHGKINVWSPAASKPRGYPRAAREMLQEAAAQLRAEGKVKQRRRR